MNRKRINARLSSVLVGILLFSQISVSAVQNTVEESAKENEIQETDDEIIKDVIIDDIVITQETNKENEAKEESTIRDTYDNTASEEELIGEKYEVKKDSSADYLPRLEVYEEESFNLKQQSFLNMQDTEKLEKKTDADYEIALAHEDGTYSFIGSAENFEEAMDKVETIEEEVLNEVVADPMSTASKSFKVQALGEINKSSYSSIDVNNVIASYVSSEANNGAVPVILNSTGNVVYSTKSMGRILKHIDGKIYPYFDKNTDLYSDASLTKVFNYINQGYVDDVPIIEDKGTSAKILVSGYTGWINKNEGSGNYDMIVVPLNQVTNPSYYISENGVLKHFITSDLKGTPGFGTTITIGKAPSYLKNGVRYLSYDGHYFYNGTNIEQGLDKLIGDLQKNTHGNAVNANNPYYNYFNYLPFRSKTNYTSAQLDSFINAKTEANSKLRGTGAAFIAAQNKYGVNALLALGVAINESNWGRSSIAQSKNNIFGLNAIDSNPGQAADSFAKVADSINDFAKNYISRGYADPADWRYYGGFLGNKAHGANIKYASDPYWGEKASQYAFLADYHLSGNNLNNLQDNDYYQLAIYTSANTVKSSNGTLLYKVIDNYNEYAAYVGTPVIINSKNGSSYEIYPERNTPVNNGGYANKYHGNYNFEDKGYISVNGVQFINEPIQVGKWISKDGKWYYEYRNGVKATMWKEINGKWYYFYNDGTMATGWLNYDGKWYYFWPSSGSMAAGSWVKDNGYWYYLTNNGVMATGWIEDKGYKYYLWGGGSMATGWVKDGGNWYYFWDGGSMATGWVKYKDYWYYMKSDGSMATGWQYIGGNWYYFWGGGSMAAGSWIQDNGKWYYLNSNGVLQ